MHRKELNERSPLRVLDQSIHGGLGKGNLGVVVARHGVGKTAFLVGIALDDLMRGQKVLHFSLEHTVDRVCEYYDELYMELCHSRNLEDQWKVRLDTERNRRIHSFLDQDFSVTKLRDTIQFARDFTDFVPDALIIDGLDFNKVGIEDLNELREIAQELNAEVWMSAITTRDADRNDRGIPQPVDQIESAVDVVLNMGHDGTSVHIGLLKDHKNPNVSDLKLALDPTTLLVVRE